MTWNVENLYRPGTEYGPRTESAYDAKLDRLAATIDGTGPHVVAAQEVGDPAALDDLVDRLDGDWSIVLAQVADARGLRVGVLTRQGVARVEDVADFPAPLAPIQADDQGGTTDAMGRGALRVTVVSDEDTPVDIITVHLKSKLISYPDGRFSPRNEDERARYGGYALFRRAAEAVTVRTYANEVLDGHGAERTLVLLGDLNDEPQAATTQVLLGPPGSEIGTAGERVPDQGDAWRLWNLAPLIPADERFTRVYRGRGELIDHILVSRALLERVVSVRSLVERPLPSIDDDPRGRLDARDSDHAPVIATLDV